ncbi:hypothetical protein AX16_007423 [Volvariella volvacea WC 439]|nr:hypothetical protein AX16_007423 [Volvariella volvacea WC 439]
MANSNRLTVGPAPEGFCRRFQRHNYYFLPCYLDREPECCNNSIEFKLAGCNMKGVTMAELEANTCEYIGAEVLDRGGEPVRALTELPSKVINWTPAKLAKQLAEFIKDFYSQAEAEECRDPQWRLNSQTGIKMQQIVLVGLDHIYSDLWRIDFAVDM